MTENEKYLYDRIKISVKSGFVSFDDIIDETLEAIDDEGWGNEIPEEWVRETTQRKFDQNMEESKLWQHPTPTEQLHAVFDKLCENKIIALHNAGYETSDAVYDAQELWKELEDAGVKPIGYCYYHGQDLERVIEDGLLCVGFYGEKEKNEKEAIQIGNKVASLLKEAGFVIEWNGTAKQRITIVDFNWQNVFTSDDEVDEKWGYDRVLKLMDV